MRVINDAGKNIGIMPISEALEKAEEQMLDLIEISPNAKPPIVKITDYGKFQYDLKKKQKEIKAKTNTTETKVLQVKIATGEHDLNLKAKKASKWLKKGHRVKLDLFLAGRAKYLKQDFLKERMDRLLVLITENYRIADGPKKSPKGLTVILEKTK